MKKNIVNIILILLAAGFLYKVIWYNRTMPSEPKLESGWTDIEFSNNYGSAVMHEFLTLNLQKDDFLNVPRYRGFSLSSQKSNGRIFALIDTKGNDVDKIISKLIKGREGIYQKRSPDKNRIFFYNAKQGLLVRITGYKNESTCVIEPITREEWEKL